MAAIRSFVRREPELLIAAFAALLGCFFVPPDQAYLGYMDYRTLSLLYCLMTVVAGLRQAGLFAHLAHSLCENVKSVRMIGLVLVLLCFFSAMLITNDVALLTFVPFAVVVLGMADRKKDLIVDPVRHDVLVISLYRVMTASVWAEAVCQQKLPVVRPFPPASLLPSSVLWANPTPQRSSFVLTIALAETPYCFFLQNRSGLPGMLSITMSGMPCSWTPARFPSLA